MRHRLKFTFILGFLGWVFLVPARFLSVQCSEPEHAKSPWHGTNFQLGFNKNTGNTDTADFTSQVNLNYNQDRWVDKGQAQFQWGKSNGLLEKQSYFLTNQTDYAFDTPRKNFVFLSETFTVDHFSPYNYQTLLAAGLGHDIIRNDWVLWSVQAGPGYSWYQATGTNNNYSNAVATTGTNFGWYINEATEFSEGIIANLSEPYNYYKSTTALTSTLSNNFAIQISYTIQYYSQIPPLSTRTNNLDTTTLVSLIYNFV